jgi:carbonic anhydrase/acetyltransferase-like protein (isoleucine patch superfamily)
MSGADSPSFEGVWVAPGVQIYGAVSIEDGCSLWPNSVIRAECCEVRIGRMTNIQDHVMVHIGYGSPTIIGEFCSITHHATVHGARIGDASLIGIGAVIMDGAEIGEGSIVAGGAVVSEGKIFPPNSVIAGVPAKLIKTRDSTLENRLNAWLYHRNAEAYRRGDHRAWDGPEFETWKNEKWRQIKVGEDLL